MKKSIFFNKVLVICAFLCAISCTNDTADITNELTEEVDVKRQVRPILSIDTTTEVLIVYVKKTPESIKNQIREKYKELLLISDITKCEADADAETWGLENFAAPPLPEAGTSEEPLKQYIEHVIFNANCDDIKPRK